MKREDFWMIILTLVIALSSVFSYISVNKQTDAIERSYLPNILYSGGICPDLIFPKGESEFDINLGNYGLIVTTISISYNVNNTLVKEILPRLNFDNNTNSDYFSLTPIQYGNREAILRYGVFVNDYNKSFASFTFRYNYLKKVNDLQTFSKSCNYKKDSDGFFILQSS